MVRIILATLVLAIVLIGCSDDSELQARLATAEAELAQAKKDLNELRESVGDLASGQILGDWSRAVPQPQRIEDNYKTLRDSVLDAEFGDASQLGHALVRIANLAALTVVGEDMVTGSESQQLETLNACLEYLLGINSATRACNLVPIAP